MEKIPHEGRGTLNMYSVTYHEHLLLLKKLDEIVDWINERDNEIDYERIARRDAVNGK